MSTDYVNTSTSDTLAYPDVLRVTFGEVPHWWTPDALASTQLASDVGRVISAIDGGAFGVAVGSDPTVPSGALAVTIDFVPTDASGNVSVGQLMNQINLNLHPAFDFIQATQVTRVEKLNVHGAVGEEGETGRGAVTKTLEQQLQETALGALLAKYFGKATTGLAIVGGVAVLIVFAPEIKAAVGALRTGRTKRPHG